MSTWKTTLHRYIVISKNILVDLEPIRQVALSAINDDYCDCEDGSDEPGEHLKTCPNESAASL